MHIAPKNMAPPTTIKYLKCLPWNIILVKFDQNWSIHSQITSNLYVSNSKSSYDVNNKMAWNIARVKLKMIIYNFTVKLLFLFYSENSVIHNYLYNNTFYSAVVLFEQSHFGFIPPQGFIRQVPLVQQELPTLPEHLSSPPVFSGVFVTQSSVFCVMFCRSLFVLLNFFFLPFCCLSFDLWILITPLVSSNPSFFAHFCLWTYLMKVILFLTRVTVTYTTILYIYVLLHWLYFVWYLVTSCYV